MSSAHQLLTVKLIFQRPTMVHILGGIPNLLFKSVVNYMQAFYLFLLSFILIVIYFFICRRCPMNALNKPTDKDDYHCTVGKHTRNCTISTEHSLSELRVIGTPVYRVDSYFLHLTMHISNLTICCPVNL